MSLTLGEVLALDCVRRAAPELVHGEHLLDRPVRWVHTSELAEAAFLLKGGELLLTTGLGLFGRGAVGETAFVEALAERGVTALALELGWTFTEAPPALVAAARRSDVALVLLHEVVPFVEMTEQVQVAMFERTAAATRRERSLRERLTDALLDGAGPAELAAELAGHVGAPVMITTSDGALVAAAGHGIRGRPARSVCRRDVMLLDRHWGRVAVLAPARPDDPAVVAACAAGAEALGLALLRSVTADDLAARRRRLIQDLVERRFDSPEELVGKAGVLGLPFDAGARYVALLVRGLPVEGLSFALGAVESALSPVAALVGDIGADVVVIAATAGGEGAGRSVLAALEALPGAGLARVVVGPAVTSLSDAGRSVSEARRAMELASGLDLPERFLSAGALTAQVLLGELVGLPSAQRLVTDEIGPVLDHDRRRGTALADTLRVYLAHGSNKVSAAAALHVRRQTMYQRLARIGQLIGDVDAPNRHTGLVVALALAALDDGASDARREDR